MKKLLAILLALPSIGFAKEVKCLSEMAYYEARGEGAHGIKVVTDVMFNRMNSNQFPDGVCANFRKHGQYSTAKMAGGRKDKELYKKISFTISITIRSCNNFQFNLESCGNCLE